MLWILVEVDERDEEKEKEMDGMVKRKSGHWYLLYMFHEIQITMPYWQKRETLQRNIELLGK